jgi:hypothetical protein
MTVKPTKPLRFISIRKQRILAGMPKVKPTVSRTKKPTPMIEPIPVIAPTPVAVIPALKPGSMAKNLSGKLSRPNPIRRGRK